MAQNDMRLSGARKPGRGLWGEIVYEYKKRKWLYAMLLIPLAYVITFAYVPMGGILMAFQEYSLRGGLFGSEWVGLTHFRALFSNPLFYQLLRNTVYLSLYGFLAGFPMPILLALCLNETRSASFRKTVQMVTYAPYFISTVVMVSVTMQFLSIRTGMINHFIKLLGRPEVNFMGTPGYFRSIYVWSGIWQSMGYSAVIYLAALSGVDPSLQEASIIDGASRFQRVLHVDLPCILPTIVISMILSMGGLLSVGFEKAYLLQNSLNTTHSEVISTYVYKRGLISYQYSYSTAVGLFNSIANLILLSLANGIARRLSETSLW